MRPVSSTERLFVPPTVVVDPLPTIPTLPLPSGKTGLVPEFGVIVSKATPLPVSPIVMELEPLVIETPVPAVKVAAAGAPEVDPMINWPSVASAVAAGTPVAPVVSTALLAVASPVTVLDALLYRI